MGNLKISKLLNDSTVSKFVIEKIYDLSSGKYSANKNSRFKTSMLRSDLFDYTNAYIVVKGKTAIEGDNNVKTIIIQLIFKNNVPFRSFLSKINNTFIDNP